VGRAINFRFLFVLIVTLSMAIPVYNFVYAQDGPPRPKPTPSTSKMQVHGDKPKDKTDFINLLRALTCLNLKLSQDGKSIEIGKPAKLPCEFPRPTLEKIVRKLIKGPTQTGFLAVSTPQELVVGRHLNQNFMRISLTHVGAFPEFAPANMPWANTQADVLCHELWEKLKLAQGGNLKKIHTGAAINPISPHKTWTSTI